jgi:hypothetical protein
LIRKKKCNVNYFIVKRTSNFKSLIMSGAAATVISPERGGIHPTYGVFSWWRRRGSRMADE